MTSDQIAVQEQKKVRSCYFAGVAYTKCALEHNDREHRKLMLGGLSSEMTAGCLKLRNQSRYSQALGEAIELATEGHERTGLSGRSGRCSCPHNSLLASVTPNP